MLILSIPYAMSQQSTSFSCLLLCAALFPDSITPLVAYVVVKWEYTTCTKPEAWYRACYSLPSLPLSCNIHLAAELVMSRILIFEFQQTRAPPRNPVTRKIPPETSLGTYNFNCKGRSVPLSLLHRKDGVKACAVEQRSWSDRRLKYRTFYRRAKIVSASGESSGARISRGLLSSSPDEGSRSRNSVDRS